MVTPPSKDTRKRNNHKDGKPNVASDEGWKVCGEEGHFPSAHSLAPRGAREPAREEDARSRLGTRSPRALSAAAGLRRHRRPTRMLRQDSAATRLQSEPRKKLKTLHLAASNDSCQLSEASYERAGKAFRPPHMFVHSATKRDDIRRAFSHHIESRGKFEHQGWTPSLHQIAAPSVNYFCSAG